MALKTPDRRTFITELKEIVTPAHPVLYAKHLKGRDIQLKKIEQALYAVGRNIFIYGERGVGKSSLAATAANEWMKNQADADPNTYIDIACSRDTTIFGMIGNVARQATYKSRLLKKTVKKSLNINLKWISYKRDSENQELDFSKDLLDLNDCIELLKEIQSLYLFPLIVVVDEVDQIKDPVEIERLANLLKQLGDKRVDVKFIFTGIAKTLDEILGSHRSAIRQLETIELEKLSWDARWNIAVEALEHFGVSIDHEICIRIAMICDGYPYYVHLIVEKLLWHLFYKESLITEITWDDYHQAVVDAVDGISSELSRPYLAAITQRSQDYEEIVWATLIADDNIGVYLNEIYSHYKFIMNQRKDKIVLDQTKFSTRVRNLVKENYGPILCKGLKSGQYVYKEKMLRGYVRLKAEAQKIELNLNEAKEIDSLRFKAQASARTNKYFESRIPRKW
ncbi:ATP-binding protein [Acinetobacter baumannii]|uniref:ATP-binding protein n=1 Tax=Acinetobacter baumannii TaxID=470 RepID=UPI001C0B1163|nr:ATP-binding protein [Acinetobacter baumannii]MBU3096082.1 ATP-binding protein [Acinetobacter baumannii]